MGSYLMRLAAGTTWHFQSWKAAVKDEFAISSRTTLPIPCPIL